MHFITVYRLALVYKSINTHISLQINYKKTIHYFRTKLRRYVRHIMVHTSAEFHFLTLYSFEDVE